MCPFALSIALTVIYRGSYIRIITSCLMYSFYVLLTHFFSQFVLFAVFGPLELKAIVIRACNQLLRWIKREEGRLFILNSPVF